MAEKAKRELYNFSIDIEEETEKEGKEALYTSPKEHI